MQRRQSQELAEALEDLAVSSSKLRNGANSSPASSASGSPNRPKQLTVSSARLQRQASLDDRRFPPTLPSIPDDEVSASVPLKSSPNHPGARSRSGTRSSRELLRRYSSETTHTLDFASDGESFHVRPPSVMSYASRRTSLQGIRIRDNSLDENLSFARDVRIPAYHTVGGSLGGYVTYECIITTKDHATITRMKRYSAFCSLRDDLMRTFPSMFSLLDGLPPKSLAKYRAAFLEKRRKRLAFWLATVLLHPQLGSSKQARAWVLE